MERILIHYSSKVAMLSLVMCIYSIQDSYSHSGGTDHEGGHFIRRTGEYHFHHGERAHQHAAGRCPYDRVTINPKFTQHSRADNEVSLEQKWNRSALALIAGVVTGWIGWQQFFSRKQSLDK
ncbi:MAG: YHYH domain-containing protein [Candidatus Kapabacteria bacterium]|nr:YHYH domain-containing protein [Candidatus Kapabacteria bacterium]